MESLFDSYIDNAKQINELSKSNKDDNSHIMSKRNPDELSRHTFKRYSLDITKPEEKSHALNESCGYNVVINNLMNNDVSETICNALESSIALNNIWKHCEILLSPSDGHCFLHSIVSSIREQLSPGVHVDLLYLINAMKWEVSQNLEKYIIVTDGNDVNTLYSEFCLYIRDKIYDTNFGDLVPIIICDALHINCVIINENQDGTFVSQPLKSDWNGITLLLHKQGKHYNGIRPKVRDAL